MVSLETEIRKLRPANLSRLAELLSPHLWKNVMGNIKKPGSRIDSMFTSEHIAMIETAAAKQRKSASEIFLDEWGTMGRERPTIRTTIELLVATELFRAADYLAVEVMKGSAPDRPAKGPAAAIEIPAEIVGEYSQQDDNSDEYYMYYHNTIETLDHHHAHSPKLSRHSSSNIAADLSTPAVSLLQNLSALELGSEQHSAIQDDLQPCHLQNYPQEMASSELPLCINDRAVASSRNNDHPVTCTDSLVSLANTSDCSESYSFPAMLMEHNRLREHGSDPQGHKSFGKDVIDYNELPLTVVALCKN